MGKIKGMLKSRERKTRKRNVGYSLLTFIASFVALFIMLSLYLIDNMQDDVDNSVRHTSSQIDRILDEQRGSLKDVSPLTVFQCTQRTKKNLSTISVNYKYIASISILKDHTFFCSSALFRENKSFTLNSDKDEGLLLWSDDEKTDMVRWLSLWKKQNSRIIMSTVDINFILDLLDSLPEEIHPVFSVNGLNLSKDGVATFKKTDSETLSIGSDVMYSYRIFYKYLDCWDHLYDGKYFHVFFVCFISLLIGFGVYLFLSKKTSIQKTLELSIEHGEIVPFFQPIISTSTKKIAGVEVLARWISPELGFIAPDIFIPVAEKSNQIVPLTESLAVQVLQSLELLKNNIPDGFSFSFNVSHSHLQDSNFETFVSELNRSLSFYQCCLTLEITERENIVFNKETMVKLERIKQHGVKLSIDDFGTGFSNISYLAEEQFDNLKIDKMFIKKVNHLCNNALIESVIDMAKKLKISITAEGVETEEQLQYLEQKNVDFVQGYLFAKPMNVNGLFDYLEQNNTNAVNRLIMPGCNCSSLA
ncbi:EAL domain-containing protein [Klebsiella aerogenes]